MSAEMKEMEVDFAGNAAARNRFGELKGLIVERLQQLEVEKKRIAEQEETLRGSLADLETAEKILEKSRVDYISTVEVAVEEGGKWVPFTGQFKTVHSIKFADGKIWDTRNGWRL